jgi:hypothetical protein
MSINSFSLIPTLAGKILLKKYLMMQVAIDIN